MGSLKSSRPGLRSKHNDTHALALRRSSNALHTSYRRGTPVVQIVVEQSVSSAKLEILHELVVEHESQRVEDVELGLFNNVSCNK